MRKSWAHRGFLMEQNKTNMSDTLIQYNDGRESTISHESEQEALVEATQSINEGFAALWMAITLGGLYS